MSSIPNEPRLMTPREARRSLLMAAIGAMTIVASFAYAPVISRGPVLCPFRFLTGVPCPGCGLTRSFCALTHGDVTSAFAFHLFGPILMLALLVGVPLLLIEGVTRRANPMLSASLFSKRGAAIAAIAFGGYHFVRLIVMGWDGTLWQGMQHPPIASAIHWLLAHVA